MSAQTHDASEPPSSGHECASLDRDAGRPPIITEHARDQWTDRVCSRQRGFAPWDITDAFEAAEPVGTSGEGHSRLHESSGAVFVFTHDWWSGPPVVVTVLLDSMVYTSDEYLDQCPWCGRDLS